MNNQQIVDTIALIAGVLLSVLVEIPVIKQQFDTLSKGAKRLVMAGLLIVAAGVVYGLGCAGLLDILAPGAALTCDNAGIIVLVRVLILAIASNQGAFGLFFRK